MEYCAIAGCDRIAKGGHGNHADLCGACHDAEESLGRREEYAEPTAWKFALPPIFVGDYELHSSANGAALDVRVSVHRGDVFCGWSTLVYFGQWPCLNFTFGNGFRDMPDTKEARELADMFAKAWIAAYEARVTSELESIAAHVRRARPTDQARLMNMLKPTDA